METKSSEVDLEELPEGCIANILSFTTPLDACKLSVVSKTFRSAADSDDLWDKLLPSDYHSIISRSSSFSSSSSSLISSKKQLYFHLCHNPILIDDSKKSFSLEKQSGKKCYMIAARDLMIAWGGTPQYWQWKIFTDSRFAEVAELEFVWWLEIRGKIDTSILSPETNYAAYLVFRLREGAYGLDSYATLVSIGIVGGEKHRGTVCLVPDEERRRVRSRRSGSDRVAGLESPKRRQDSWLEIEIGEYVNRDGEDGELEMSVMEVHAAKAGLIVQGIELRPKVVQ
ncbi:F-box protein At2g02240-like isoform X2 [Mercurialis annua]|uniref:F-box protein At2g02240-like isoform X2 n=1 Tax=Mercurialis annua TaxID=3986 RepID=UPI00215EF468|nr:F-box protein At2g02240-like isoform X2 [Mercurialis annua]